MSKTIYERIWDEEIPSYPLYRNENHGLLAILDIHPATPGHTLVIPREPVDCWTDMEPERYRLVAAFGHSIARHLQDVLEPNRVLKFTLGYDVAHVHEHLVPSYNRDDSSAIWGEGRTSSPINGASLQAVQDAVSLRPNPAARLSYKLDQIAK